jgi:hypothetical protein
MTLPTLFHDELMEHTRLIAGPEEVEIGVCLIFQHLQHAFGYFSGFGLSYRRQRVGDRSHMIAFIPKDLVK